VGIPISEELSLKAIPFTERNAPLVPDQYKDTVKQIIARNQVKNQVRRGGVINDTVQEKVSSQQLRYT